VGIKRKKTGLEQNITTFRHTSGDINNKTGRRRRRRRRRRRWLGLWLALCFVILDAIAVW